MNCANSRSLGAILTILLFQATYRLFYHVETIGNHLFALVNLSLCHVFGKHRVFLKVDFILVYILYDLLKKLLK